jgi:hypothetical protein
VTMQNAILLDIMLCSHGVHGDFGGTYCLHLQGQRLSLLSYQQEAGNADCGTLDTTRQTLLATCFLLVTYFDPKDGCSTFLTSIRLHSPLHPRRQYS